MKPYTVHDGEFVSRRFLILVLNRYTGSSSRVRHVSMLSIDGFSLLTVLIFSGMVYDDAEKLYAEVRKDGEYLLEEAFGALFPKSFPLTSATVKAPGNIVAFNTTPFPRRDVVQVPLSPQMRSKVVQGSKDGLTGFALFDCSKGENLAHPTGFFADCMPVSGETFTSSLIFHDLMPVVCSVHQQLRSLRPEKLQRTVNGIEGKDHQSH